MEICVEMKSKNKKIKTILQHYMHLLKKKIASIAITLSMLCMLLIVSKGSLTVSNFFTKYCTVYINFILSACMCVGIF